MARTPYQLFLSAPISARAKLVFQQMQHFSKSSGRCFASYSKIGAALSLSRWQVCRAVAELKAATLLVVVANSAYNTREFVVLSLALWATGEEPPKTESNSATARRRKTCSNSAPKKPPTVAVSATPSEQFLQRPIKNSVEETEIYGEQKHENYGSSTALMPVSAPSSCAVVKTPAKTEFPDRERFEKLLGIFLALGKGLSPSDLRNCERFWRALKPHERAKAHDCAVRMVDDWATRPTDKIPQPWNYLGGKYWEREQERMLRRKPPTKQELASERFLRSKGIKG